MRAGGRVAGLAERVVLGSVILTAGGGGGGGGAVVLLVAGLLQAGDEFLDHLDAHEAAGLVVRVAHTAAVDACFVRLTPAVACVVVSERMCDVFERR